MRPRLSPLLALVPVALCLVACKKDDVEVIDGSETKPPVAFEGTLDEKYVGTWKGAIGTYTIKPDGNYDFVGSITTPNGKMENRFSAEWKAKDGQLLFRDANGVVPYNAKLEGDTLTLSLTGSLKNETVLKKQ